MFWIIIKPQISVRSYSLVTYALRLKLIYVLILYYNLQVFGILLLKERARQYQYAMTITANISNNQVIKVQYVTRVRKVYLVHNKREEYGHVYEMPIR